MKKIIGILLTSTVLSASAFANAGPAAPAPCPACPEASVAKWGGFKLGAQLGYAHAASRLNATGTLLNNVVTRADDFSAKGLLGGLHLGYDFQASKTMLVGVETSFDFSGLKGNTNISGAGLNVTADNFKSNWTVAVVPRVGMVLNDSLFYVGAGWAGSKITYTDGQTATNGTRVSNVRSALRLSAGAAQRMNKVLLGVEANYDFYSSVRKNSIDAANATDLTTTFKPRVFSAKIKLSYMM